MGWLKLLLRHVLNLGNYITKSQGQKFQWGTMDCNIFVAGAIDAMLGTQRCKNQIQGQYSDEKSAVRFQRRYVPAEEYIQQMGWAKTDDVNIQETDIVLCDHEGYRPAHIVFANKIWSCHKDHGVVSVDSLEQMTMPYTIWRRK